MDKSNTRAVLADILQLSTRQLVYASSKAAGADIFAGHFLAVQSCSLAMLIITLICAMNNNTSIEKKI